MRLLFFILVLANLLFYGWHTGYLGPGESSRGEGDRLAQQIAPEKIRILTPAEARRMTDEARARTNACVEWGTFPAQEAERAAEALAALNLGNRLTQRLLEETAGWWVFLPPQGNKINADKKVEELKRLNVGDFFVVQDEGPSQFAVSLGVFRTEDAAKSYLVALSLKGVRTARAEPRETKVMKTAFRLSNLDEAASARFEALKKEFPGHDTKDCTSAEKKAEPRKSDGNPL